MMIREKMEGMGFRACWQSGVLVLIAAVVGLFVNQIRSDGMTLTGPGAYPAPLVAGEGDRGTVSIEEAGRLFQNGQAVFLDARSPEEYAEGHLPGARSLPLQAFEQFAIEVLSDIPQGAILIAYCDGIQCPLADKLAENLREMGYEDVRTLPNGLSAWRKNNLPVEKGAGSPVS